MKWPHSPWLGQSASGLAAESMPLPSIRKRLTRALVVVSVAWGLAVAGVVWLVVRHEMDEVMDATLSEAGQILHGLLSYNLSQLPLHEGSTLPAPPHKEEIVWQLVDASQRVLLRSHQAPPQPLTDAARAVEQGFVTVADQWRVHASRIDNGGLVLLVAQTASERADAQLEIAKYTSGAALAVGLLCALWLSRRVRHELLSISELSAAVDDYDPLQTSSVLSPVHRLELLPMWRAISQLGARLAQHVANERAFSAHAAHALRTPLAGMVTQLALAQRASPPAAQPRLALVRAAADRLRRVVTALLALFRSGTQVHWQAVDLEELAPQLQVHGLSLQLRTPARLKADPDLLAAALANLLDNAVRHGAAVVALTVEHGPDGAVVRLQDDGPGVSAAARADLQDALATQRYEGRTGLGLMLADLVARAHGGQVQLPASPTGFSVALHLPKQPAAAAPPDWRGMPESLLP